MTILLRGENSYFFGAQAQLIDDTRDIASGSDWASEYIHPNPNLKWVLGRYVEADKANNNRQYWSLDDLRLSEPTIKHSPLNMLHQKNRIVGSLVGSKLLYPTEGLEQAGVVTNPYIEALGVFWKDLNPEDLIAVEKAYNQGALFFSMECKADTVTFVDHSGEEETFPYAGPLDPSYGKWNTTDYAHRQLNSPHFLGAALIIPPIRPGWSNADIKDLSENTQAKELYSQLKSDYAHLTEQELEGLTFNFMSETSKNSITNSSVSNTETAKKSGKSKKSKAKENINPQQKEGGDDVAKTHTEEEVEAFISELAALKEELSTLKASKENAEVESRISELTEQYSKEVADLQAKLDAAVADTEDAKNEKAEIVTWLETEKAAADEAEQASARMDERLAAVKEVASFPEDYVEANKERWSTMDEASFEAVLDVLKARQETKEEVTKVASETAMSATSRSDTAAASTTNLRKEVFALRRTSLDPRKI